VVDAFFDQLDRFMIIRDTSMTVWPNLTVDTPEYPCGMGQKPASFCAGPSDVHALFFAG
jgi:hypothetical protein